MLMTPDEKAAKGTSRIGKCHGLECLPAQLRLDIAMRHAYGRDTWQKPNMRCTAGLISSVCSNVALGWLTICTTKQSASRKQSLFNHSLAHDLPLCEGVHELSKEGGS